MPERPRRVVGVVPAAGRAERLQPLPCSKEALPVGGRPVLAYLVERMRAAAPDEIRVVTRAEKQDVVELAKSLDATVILGDPPTLGDSLRLGAESLGREDLILVGFPDTIWEPADGFVRLLAAFGPGVDVVLGLFAWDEAERSQLVELEDDGVVRAIDLSPGPGRGLVWGCAVVRGSVLAGLERHDHPGALFDRLARTGRVLGVVLSEDFADIGTREALGRAELAARR